MPVASSSSRIRKPVSPSASRFSPTATMIGSARQVTAPRASTPLNTVVVTTAAATPAQALPVHQLTVTAENAPHRS